MVVIAISGIGTGQAIRGAVGAVIAVGMSPRAGWLAPAVNGPVTLAAGLAVLAS